jgi:hypothetical protein
VSTAAELHSIHKTMDNAGDIVHFRSRGGDLRVQFYPTSTHEVRTVNSKPVAVSEYYVMSPACVEGGARLRYYSLMMEALGCHPRYLRELSRPVCVVESCRYGDVFINCCILLPLIHTTTIQVPTTRHFTSQESAQLQAMVDRAIDGLQWKGTYKKKISGYTVSGKYAFEVLDCIQEMTGQAGLISDSVVSLAGLHGSSFVFGICASEDPSTMYNMDNEISEEAESLRPCYSKLYIMSENSIEVLMNFIERTNKIDLSMEKNSTKGKFCTFRLPKSNTTTCISFSHFGRISGNGDWKTLMEILKRVRGAIQCLMQNSTQMHDFTEHLDTL